MERGTTLQSGLLALAFGGLFAAGMHLLLGDVNLNFSDEGYLWYGVKGVLAGEVPFRDFQAYDPGRYRWCALWSHVFGSGILGVRASLAVFQALGLAAGLLVARRFLKHDLWMLPLALVLGLWMFPRHKLFEPALAMLVLWSCVRFLERPNLARHLAAGVTVGLAAWFGRNHGFYAALSMTAAFGYSHWKLPGAGWLSRLGVAALGVLLGYLPMLFSLAFVPGFRTAYWAELNNLAHKGANLALPYAWPWSSDWSAAENAMQTAGLWATNLAFALPLIVLPLALWRLLRLQRERLPGAHERGFAPAQAALIGATWVGMTYLHHVSIRSDAQHLAQCVEPLLLAGLALGVRRWAQLSALLALSCLTFFFSFHNHSTLRYFAPWKPSYGTVEQALPGESLRLNAGQARTIQALLADVGARLQPEDQIFIAPMRATFYPLLGKRSPVREIYLLWPASEDEQRAMIASLEAQQVRWALLLDGSVDERDDLRFANTHPLVWQHLMRNFGEVPTGLGREHHLLRRGL